MSVASRNGILVGSVLVVCLLLFVRGCGGYDSISQPAYETTIALYSTCHRQDLDTLATIEGHVKNAMDSGEITVQEAGWLNEIASVARQGQWSNAAEMCRGLLEAQVAEE